MQSLFFMGRHGTTHLNAEGRYRGWSDGPEAQLDEEGRLWAHRQGQFLASLGEPFSLIIASPFGRTQETAAIVAGYLGLKEFRVDDRLKPLNVGDLTGQLKSENPIHSYLKHPKKKFPGGESVDDFESRQHAFANDLLDLIQHTKGEILVEAHVSNMMYWWNAMQNKKQEEYLDEASDIVQPGGVSMITPLACLPLFRSNGAAEGEERPSSKTMLSALSQGYVAECEEGPEFRYFPLV